MLTGQPMLTSIRCDSLVDGVWFDEWTIGKLLKSKHENKDDPVKVPSVLQQNLCQMAARTIAQMYIPRLRRLGSERLAAMLDSAVLVRPVAGAGLLIKGHSILLTGALMTPTGALAVPPSEAVSVGRCGSGSALVGSCVALVGARVLLQRG